MLQPLCVNNTPVELVDEFDHLGTRIWWRWDWTKAWAKAQSLANQQIGAMKLARFTYKNWSPFTAFVFANGKIFCHFNTIAAIAGAGGTASSAPWSQNEQIVTETMNTLLRVKFASKFAIRCEFGIWDSRSRIDMLLLRFWAKVITCPPESTHFRALCLSFSSLSPAQQQNPDRCSAQRGRTHHQSWAQQALAAAQRNGVSQDAIIKQLNILVEIHFCDSTGQWYALRSEPALVCLLLTLSAAHHGRRFRLAVAEVGRSGFEVDGYTEGVNCWTLPSGTRLHEALATWSEQLRMATFASLRQRGNSHRQAAVHQHMQAEAVRPDSQLRRYIRIKPSSFLEAYLFLPMELARRVLQSRLDAAPNEGAMRRMPRQVKGTRQVQTQLPRIPEHLRACYLCDAVDGVDGVYWPETIEHVLLTCPFYQEIRIKLVRRLQRLSTEAATVEVTKDVLAPNFEDPASLFAVIFLCTNLPDQPVLHQHLPPPAPLQPATGVRTRSAVAADVMNQHARADARRRGPQVEVEPRAARSAATWTSTLLSDWSNKIRDCRSSDPSKSPGRRLAKLIAKYHHNVFRVRRKALQSNINFTTRDRDPCDTAQQTS